MKEALAKLRARREKLHVAGIPFPAIGAFVRKHGKQLGAASPGGVSGPAFDKESFHRLHSLAHAQTWLGLLLRQHHLLHVADTCGEILHFNPFGGVVQHRVRGAGAGESP
jgi:hypothetical protein